MIVTDDIAPRWIRELARFIPLKNLLLLHGNVLDLVAYPVRDKADGEPYWTDGDLGGFFERFLTDQGYDVIGIVDPVDGLRLARPDMQEPFQRAISEQQASAKGTEPRPTEPVAQPLRAATGRSPSGASETDIERTIENIRCALRHREIASAFVIHLASRLVSSPTGLTRQERSLFTRLLKASLESREVIRGGERRRNSLVVVCDRLNDLPPFLYLGNPRARSILVDKPDASDRARFLRARHGVFFGAEPDKPASPDLASQFSLLTDGFTNYEMMSLISLSHREKLPLSRMDSLCERFKYGIKESAWDKIDQARLRGAEAFIRGRIRGQDAAVARVLDIIKRAKLGLAATSERRNLRPRGVLFFAGPTGVGKTEMAKALAALLFGSDERLIRFDMSEYAAEHADQKLMGAPPGYVGYEEGGQLTNRVKQNPFSVLLFDEIEKAHARIFDKFLQILDDGRLTDGKGETVYFSESIIVFTSNLGTISNTPDRLVGAPTLVTPEMSYDRMRELILGRLRDHFNLTLGRPEILNRMGDNFVVFDFIRPPVDAEIVDLLLKGLSVSLARDRGIVLSIAEGARITITELARRESCHGGRGIRNAIDAAVVNPLARWLFDNGIETKAGLEISRIVDHGDAAAYRFTLEMTRTDRDAAAA